VAHCPGRLRKKRTLLHEVSTIRQIITCTHHTYRQYLLSLAVHAVGDGTGRTSAPSFETKKIYHSGRRLLYKVDKSRTLSVYHRGTVAKFFRNSIIYCFGIPKYLVTDNGSQFASPDLRELCGKYNITQKFTSVYHPQANGQVENANRTILDGLKKRLEGAKGNWPDILPTVCRHPILSGSL
jgi:transposase InsO family protein